MRVSTQERQEFIQQLLELAKAVRYQDITRFEIANTILEITERLAASS
jgi:hypothetical protein